MDQTTLIRIVTECFLQDSPDCTMGEYNDTIYFPLSQVKDWLTSSYVYIPPILIVQSQHLLGNWDCESLNGASISFFRVSTLASALELA